MEDALPVAPRCFEDVVGDDSAVEVEGGVVFVAECGWLLSSVVRLNSEAPPPTAPCRMLYRTNSGDPHVVNLDTHATNAANPKIPGRSKTQMKIGTVFSSSPLKYSPLK